MGPEHINDVYDRFIQAERFGIPAILHEYKTVLSHWDGNCRYLAELFCALDEIIWERNHSIDDDGYLFPNKGDEYLPIYLCLWAETDRFARENLNRADYHAFCGRSTRQDLCYKDVVAKRNPERRRWTIWYGRKCRSAC